MKIGIIGLGLIGGSLAMSLRKHTEHTVFGYDIDPEVMLRARAVEAIHDALTEEMLPGCDLLTPNRPEAEMLTGLRISSTDDAAAAGEKLLNMGAKAVLIKGGHMESSVVVTDCLCLPGQPPKFLPQAKVETTNNHGTGCTLSAAIATGLGKGLPLQTAVAGAQEFLNLALRRSYAPGKGCGPVNHAAGLQFRGR